MITEKDRKIITHLRNDARKKVTEIALDIDIPATTIYDKIKSHKRKGIIKKHTTLLDYSKLGYNTNVMLAFKVEKEKRQELSDYLHRHPNVNTLFRTDFGYDYLAEVVFEDFSQLREFLDDTESGFNAKDTQIFNLIKELKKEEFLS